MQIYDPFVRCCNNYRYDGISSLWDLICTSIFLDSRYYKSRKHTQDFSQQIMGYITHFCERKGKKKSENKNTISYMLDSIQGNYIKLFVWVRKKSCIKGLVSFIILHYYPSNSRFTHKHLTQLGDNTAVFGMGLRIKHNGH